MTNDVKKQEVLKILAEIQTSAMVLLSTDDTIDYTPAQLVAELALIRYEIDSYESLSSKIRGVPEIAEILEFEPKKRKPIKEGK